MHRSLILSLFLAVLLPGSGFGGEIKVIELTDGSTLTGEVLSMSNGAYAVRTEALGTVTVPDARIKAIRARDSGPLPSTTPAGPSLPEVKALSEKMMADSEIMALIESLKNDPAFRSVLEDPAVMQAISAGDTAALLANPKFLQIMNNATVRDIERKMAK